MIALWTALLVAQGAELHRFPRVAEVDLPEQGAVRIVVPHALRTAEDPESATDLLLVDGEGHPVPVVRLDSAPTWSAHSFERADLHPTDDPGTWRVDVGQRPVDALQIRLPHAPLAATVTVRDPHGDILGGPSLIWEVRAGRQDEVPLTTPAAGLLTLELRVHSDRRAVEPVVTGLRAQDPGVQPERIRVPVASWVVQEDGWARYEVVLPQPLPVQAVWLDPVEEVFERQVSVIATPTTHARGLHHRAYPQDLHSVERIRLGHVDVEQTRVPVALRTDQLTILVEAQSKPPLLLPEVEIEIPGVELVALDPGPGPHQLYGGAPVGTSQAWDLAAAAPELAREAVSVVRPGPVSSNPDWMPPEVRANLVTPSTELDPSRFRWQHAVHGEGLRRIPLSDEVLAHARPDLSDLRLLTDDGRQVPYILQRRGGEHTWSDLKWTRTERGSTSHIEVPLPWKDAPVSSVQLHTEAPLFDRRVVLSRSGATLEPLRAVRWLGTDRPSTLGIAVEHPVGDRLVISIENGDDPPLPIERIDVRWPAWELVASLPTEPVRLVYGDPRISAPSYDLMLLQRELSRRAVTEANLGPREAANPPALTVLDKVLVTGGIGVLVLGLAGLLLALLRATPESSEGEPDPASDAPAA